MRVAVLVDLEWSPWAGGHVKCWERLSEAATHGSHGVHLDLFFQSDMRRVLRISENVCTGGCGAEGRRAFSHARRSGWVARYARDFPSLGQGHRVRPCLALAYEGNGESGARCRRLAISHLAARLRGRPRARLDDGCREQKGRCSVLGFPAAENDLSSGLRRVGVPGRCLTLLELPPLPRPKPSGSVFGDKRGRIVPFPPGIVSSGDG